MGGFSKSQVQMKALTFPQKLLNFEISGLSVKAVSAIFVHPTTTVKKHTLGNFTF